MAELVDNFWTITWDLTDQQPYTAQVLPYPSVNLSVTNTEADVTGLVRRRYDRHLIGRGYAVGARFRPGCFRPFVDFPVSELTGRHRPIAEVLGRDTTRLRRDVAAEPDPEARVTLLADFLAADWPEPDPTATRLAGRGRRRSPPGAMSPGSPRWPTLTGSTVRQLQRVFAELRGRRPEVGDPAVPVAGRRGGRGSGGAGGLGRPRRRAGLRRPGPPDPSVHRHDRDATGGVRQPGASKRNRCRRVGCSSNTCSVSYPPWVSGRIAPLSTDSRRGERLSVLVLRFTTDH